MLTRIDDALGKDIFRRDRKLTEAFLGATT